jgi:hypothetical protein
MVIDLVKGLAMSTPRGEAALPILRYLQRGWRGQPNRGGDEGTGGTVHYRVQW